MCLCCANVCLHFHTFHWMLSRQETWYCSCRFDSLWAPRGFAAAAHILGFLKLCTWVFTSDHIYEYFQDFMKTCKLTFWTLWSILTAKRLLFLWFRCLSSDICKVWCQFRLLRNSYIMRQSSTFGIVGFDLF